MRGLQIDGYTSEDNLDALALEAQCAQGRTLVIRFRRPTFHARSEVYDTYRILCARVDGVLAGTAAWAEKSVILHGERIKAAYCYDLRVLPSHRSKGVAMHLTRALFDDIGDDMDCIYTLVAAENDRCVKPAQHLFGMKLAVPCTDCVIPVYRLRRGAGQCQSARFAEVHDAYLRNRPREFVTSLPGEKLLGLAGSVVRTDGMDAGCSLWTNENLLAEEVLRVPRTFRALRPVVTCLRPFVNLPRVPRSGEVFRSWFIFDMFAESDRAALGLLAAVNNRALAEHRRFLYMFLQNNDPMLNLVCRKGHCIHRIPYLLLAKGRVLPRDTDHIYIDVRDL
jgi:GNAT superfamily N-acetyltransferase